MSDKLQRVTQALAPDRPSSGSEISVPFQRFPVEEQEPHGEFSLRGYWRTLHARRWTIFSMTAIAVALAAVYNYVQVPTYQARATIQIDRSEPDISQFDEQYAQLPEQPDYIETQYKILRSRSLSKRVIEVLDLRSRTEFQPEAEPDAPAEASVSSSVIEPAVVDKFLDRLGVSPGKGTRLVDVSFESVDRELAPAVVNTLAEEYIEHNLEAKWNATQKASTWLQDQLSTLKASLEASESRLQDYAAQHSILFVEERKDITTEKLAQLEDELTRAEADRIQKQSMAMLVEDALRRDAILPGSLNSDAYQDYQAKLAELRREHSELLVTFAPGYPKVQRVERQIEEIERSIEAEKQRMLSNVRETFEVAERREKLLKQAAWSQRARVNRLSDDFIEYNILKRDAETNRELYEGLLQRLKEAGVSAGLRASNISILDPAEIPKETYRPKKLRNLLFALSSGLLFGIGLAFVKEHLNTVVRTPEEVERMTGLGLLAVIPKSRQKVQRLSTKHIGGGGRPRDTKVLTLTGHNGPDSKGLEENALVRWAPEQALSEAYRTLRSSVLLGWDESMRRILVTSSQPEEGKTSVSLNLACSLAQLGRQVLVVDADMRRPNCARQLGVKSDYGLTDYLQGMTDLEQIIFKTRIANLSLVPAGQSSTVASDLLYSPRLSTLLQEVGRRFQHIVIDSPPSLVLSDARTIARLVEGVVLVVSDTTDRNALLRTKQTFDDAGVHFLGFVMNRVNLDNLDYGYYRNYGYYYSYSDKEG